jgi:hypothetical protein
MIRFFFGFGSNLGIKIECNIINTLFNVKKGQDLFLVTHLKIPTCPSEAGGEST